MEEDPGGVGRDQGALSRRAVVAALGALGGFGLGAIAEVPTFAAPTSSPVGVGWADTIGSSKSPGGLRKLVGSTVAEGTEVVLVTGYWRSGDGGGGVFYWDPNTEPPDDAGTIIVPVAEPRAGCWRRVIGDHVDVRWFGARGDGASDDLGAFQAAIAFRRASDGLRGPRVVVPPGTYHLSAPLVVDRQVTLCGTSGMGGSASSILSFPAGVSGLVVAKNGDGSVIQGLAIGGAQGTSGDAHGVDLRARATIDQCWIKGFSGNGVHIDSSPGGIVADSWTVQYTQVEGCMHGLYTNGPFSDGGIGTGVFAKNNRGWGFFDAGHGSMFLACRAVGNALGSFLTDRSQSRSVLVGCRGDNSPSFGASTLALGGITFTEGLTDTSIGAMLSQDPNGYVASFSRGVRGTSRGGAPDKLTWAQLGMQNGIHPSPFGFGIWSITYNPDNTIKTAVASEPYRLAYIETERSPYWFFQYANLDSGLALGLGHGGGDSPNGGTAVWMFNGYHTSHGTNRVFTDAGTGPPTIGTSWTQGDRILNADPVPGHATKGFAGWICVEGSSAAVAQGRWRPFGRIE